EALSLSDRIVVMNHGRIEQIAGPQQIYDAPETLYVASFIGKMNFLEGVADERSIRIGALRFPNEKRLSGKVTAAIRPEDVVLSEAEENEERLAGRIKQVMVLGHYAEVTVELPGWGT